jgi:hypothetical protein
VGGFIPLKQIEMKFKHLIFPLIISTLISCSNNNKQDNNTSNIDETPKETTINIDEKVKEVSSNYLKDNLPDFNSYESIQWSKIDTVFGDYETSPQGKNDVRTMDSLRDLISKFGSTIEKYTKDSRTTIEDLNETKENFVKLKEEDSIKYSRNSKDTIFKRNVFNYNRKIDSMNNILNILSPILQQERELTSIWGEKDKQYILDKNSKTSNEVMGYRIDHKFRSKSKYSNMSIGRLRFFTNPNFEVVKVIDLDEIEQKIDQFNQSFNNLLH